MKAHIIIRNLIAFFAILAFLAGCGKSEEYVVNQLNAYDSTFMIHMDQMNRTEVKLAELTIEKGKDSSILNLGERMSTDHKVAFDDLLKLLQSKNLAIPSVSDSAGERQIDSLSKLIGTPFDSVYVDIEIANHRAIYTDFENELEYGSDLEIKNYAIKYFDMIKMHLQHAIAFDSMGTYKSY